MTGQTEKLVELIKTVVAKPTTSWVLFEHGTVVFFKEAQPSVESMAEAAKELMRHYGYVQVGGAHGDFGVIPLKRDGVDLGWIVTCHHPDIATLMPRDTIKGDAPEDNTAIGLYGREYRDKDAEALNIVHTELKY